MDKQKLIELYKLLHNLIDISDPDSAEADAIAYIMDKVKGLLLDR